MVILVEFKRLKLSKKKFSNEQIITALLQAGTINQAATALGCSSRLIYSRMHESDFKAEYALAKTEILRNAIARLNSALGKSVDTISDIMADTSVNPATRLQAAGLTLNYINKFYSTLENSEQILQENAVPEESEIKEDALSKALRETAEELNAERKKGKYEFF